MTVITKRFPVQAPAMLRNMGKPIEESLQALRATGWKGVYELPLFLGDERFVPKADDLIPQPILDLIPPPSEQVIPRMVPVRVGTIVNYGISQIHGDKHIWIEVEIPEEHLHHFEGSMTGTIESAPRLKCVDGKMSCEPTDEWCYFVRFNRHNFKHHFGNYGDLHCLDPEMIEEAA